MASKTILILLGVFSVNLAFAVSQAPTPSTQSLLKNEEQSTPGDRIAPEPKAKLNSMAFIKSKLAEEDAKVDYLRLDTTGNEVQLSKIDDELRGIHETLSRLDSIHGDQLKAFEKKMASNLNSMDLKLSKIENENKK